VQWKLTKCNGVIKIGDSVMSRLKLFVRNSLLLDGPILCENVENQEGMLLWVFPFRLISHYRRKQRGIDNLCPRRQRQVYIPDVIISNPSSLMVFVGSFP
jgi:hypothetical protein